MLFQRSSCDYATYEITNPQSYRGDQSVGLLAAQVATRERGARDIIDKMPSHSETLNIVALQCTIYGCPYSYCSFPFPSQRELLRHHNHLKRSPSHSSKPQTLRLPANPLLTMRMGSQFSLPNTAIQSHWSR